MDGVTEQVSDAVEDSVTRETRSETLPVKSRMTSMSMNNSMKICLNSREKRAGNMKISWLI